MSKRWCALAVLAALAVATAPGSAQEPSLKKGAVALKSAGPLAFGPKGILFVGDYQDAAVYALDTGDNKASTSSERPTIAGLDDKVAALLGTKSNEIQIRDLAVNPISGTTYLSVSRGRGPGAAAVIVRVSRDGKLSELELKDIANARAELPNAIDGKTPLKGKKGKKVPGRQEALTHIAFVKGQVIVAGLSNEEFASTLRAIPFPFDKVHGGTGIQIYHGAHGALETHSPVRVFTSYKIKGEDHLLAAYTCTPLVKFPVSDLQPGKKVKGVTIAELGNGNRPLSMIVYQKGGKDYVLMANSSRGVMKVHLDAIDSVEGIVSRVKGTAGLKYDTIKGLTGVQKLDAFDRDHAVLLVQSKGGTDLRTIELP